MLVPISVCGRGYSCQYVSMCFYTSLFYVYVYVCVCVPVFVCVCECLLTFLHFSTSVPQPPTITYQSPKDYIIDPRENININCEAKGQPHPRYVSTPAHVRIVTMDTVALDTFATETVAIVTAITLSIKDPISLIDLLLYINH